MQLEGASFQSQIARSKDMCKEYHTLFQVPKQGVYRLKILRLRTDFTAVKVENLEFPEINYEVILGMYVCMFVCVCVCAYDYV